MKFAQLTLKTKSIVLVLANMVCLWKRVKDNVINDTVEMSFPKSFYNMMPFKRYI